MIASLGMYDLPPMQAANDRLWAGIRDGMRARGIAAPDALTRGAGAYWDAWEAPDLVFSQTCGLPYRARLHGRVTLVGSPDYGLEGCPPGYYRSLYVVRRDDPRRRLQEFDGAVLAFNEDHSQSGWGAPVNDARAHGISFTTGPQTGAHRLSVRAVGSGAADIAAIDANTFALLQLHEADAVAGLVVIGATPPSPATPYIAGIGIDAGAAFAALAEAAAALAPADRQMLRLRAVARVPAADYLAVPNPPEPAQGARQP